MEETEEETSEELKPQEKDDGVKERQAVQIMQEKLTREAEEKTEERSEPNEEDRKAKKKEKNKSKKRKQKVNAAKTCDKLIPGELKFADRLIEEITVIAGIMNVEGLPPNISREDLLQGEGARIIKKLKLKAKENLEAEKKELEKLEVEQGSCSSLRR